MQRSNILIHHDLIEEEQWYTIFDMTLQRTILKIYKRMRNDLNPRKLNLVRQANFNAYSLFKGEGADSSHERERAAKFKSGLYEALKWLLIAVTQVEPFIESVI